MNNLEFLRSFPIIQYQKGESVLQEGEVSRTLLAIRSGFVKVCSIDISGNQHFLWLAGRYDIVPTEHLFSKTSPLNFFYTALSDGSAYKIDKAQFLDFAQTDAQLMNEIARSMGDHYDDLLTRVNSAGQASVHERLISTLTYLAKRFSANTVVDLHEIGLILTHQDIADMVGSTRETTSLELEKLRKAGLIEYSRTKFIIHVSDL